MVAAAKLATDTTTPPRAWPEKKGLMPRWWGNSPAVDTTPAVAIAPQVPQTAIPTKTRARKRCGAMPGTKTRTVWTEKTSVNRKSGTMTRRKEWSDDEDDDDDVERARLRWLDDALPRW